MTQLEHAEKFADLPILQCRPMPVPDDHPDVGETLLEEWSTPSGDVDITVTRFGRGRALPYEVRVVSPSTRPVVLRFMRYPDLLSAAACFEDLVGEHGSAVR